MAPTTAQAAAALAERERAFKSFLSRIGYNSVTSRFILSQGLKSSDDLQKMDQKTFQEFLQHTRSWGPKHWIPPTPEGVEESKDDEEEEEEEQPSRTRGATARRAAEAAASRSSERVSMAFLPTQMLKAAHLYVKAIEMRGLQVNMDLFKDDLASKWMERISFLHALEEDEDPKMPMKLKDASVWFEFKDEVIVWCDKKRGCALGIPLSYLIRANADGDGRLEYETIDEELVGSVKLYGTYYRKDNGDFFTFLRKLTAGGTGENTVKKFEKMKDGRGAWLALILLMEGAAGLAMQRKGLHAKNESLQYSGKGTMTLPKLVDQKIWIFSTLEKAGETVAETTQVQDLLKSVTAPHMDVAKKVIEGDEVKLNSFQAAAQFLVTADYNTKPAAQKRRVNAVKQGGKTKKQKKENQSKKPSDFKPNTRVPNDVFRSWSVEEKKEWAEMKKSAGVTAGAVNTEQFSREIGAVMGSAIVEGVKIAMMKHEEEVASGSEKEAPTKGAGTQFGRHAHKKN